MGNINECVPICLISIHLDHDECKGERGLHYDKDCHRCINTEGSYTCECDKSYELDPMSNQTCIRKYSSIEHSYYSPSTGKSQQKINIGVAAGIVAFFVVLIGAVIAVIASK